MSSTDHSVSRKICPECGEVYEAEIERCTRDGTELFAYTPSSRASTDPLVGVTLDERFRILEPLSSGSMGKVYRGIQPSVDREVAIKVLRAELLDEDTVVKRFLREARSIANLSHPHVVNLIDFGHDTTHDALYLAMELIEGRELSNLLDEGRLHPSLIVEIGQQLCRALSASHEQGLIHRDVKPSNIMLSALPEGLLQTKLVDFGIVHAVQSGTNLTRDGVICGTPYYLAPEQATSETVDERTDLYSMGIVLYEMLVGDVPYEADRTLEIAFKHVREPTPRLETHLEDEACPDALVELVERIMSKAKDERPSGALDVRDELQHIHREADWEAIDLETSSTLEPYVIGSDSGESTYEVPSPSVALAPTDPSVPPESGDSKDDGDPEISHGTDDSRAFEAKEDSASRETPDGDDRSLEAMLGAEDVERTLPAESTPGDDGSASVDKSPNNVTDASSTSARAPSEGSEVAPDATHQPFDPHAQGTPAPPSNTTSHTEESSNHEASPNATDTSVDDSASAPSTSSSTGSASTSRESSEGDEGHELVLSSISPRYGALVGVVILFGGGAAWWMGGEKSSSNEMSSTLSGAETASDHGVPEPPLGDTGRSLDARPQDERKLDASLGDDNPSSGRHTASSRDADVDASEVESARESDRPKRIRETNRKETEPSRAGSDETSSDSKAPSSSSDEPPESSSSPSESPSPEDSDGPSDSSEDDSKPSNELEPVPL